MSWALQQSVISLTGRFSVGICKEIYETWFLSQSATMINSENELCIIHLKTSYHLAINYPTIYYIYMKVVRKVKNILPYKIFIDNRKETEYAGFITHLHLLLHIVILDIEALILPWHQFTYSLFVPDGRLAAAVTNVHKFCGIANVRWQFRTQLYETLLDTVRTLR